MGRIINKGENFIEVRDLKQANGSPLLLSDVESITVQLIQGLFIQEYTYPSAALRTGDTTSQVELEVTTIISNKLVPGNVNLIWKVKKIESEFEIEGSQLDIIPEINIITVKDNI